MLKWPWNTVKERKFFEWLSEMCLDALDNEDNNSSSDDGVDDDDDDDKADNEWSGWSDWDIVDDSSVELTDKDSYVELANKVDMMLELTMNYGTYITRQLETNIDFNKPPLQVADLSEWIASMTFAFARTTRMNLFSC
jgi:hypothetical protein